MVAGAAAGMGEHLGMYPVDTIKTRMQALAHPGHYHPGEEDEFDALLSNFLHLHGYLEFGLVSLALAAAVLFFTNRNRPVRLAAAIPAADRSQASPRSE